MVDFSNYQTVSELLTEAQKADQDNRLLAKEAHLFVTDKSGQWESDWWNKNDGKPRYTFDQVSPVIDQIAGDIENSDFDIQIKPAGNDATKELAELRDGMVRNIESISDAQTTYSMAGRNIATAGIDHWLVKTDFVNDGSFDQDLIIEPLFNSSDRVWFDVGAQRQDRADSDYGFLLSAIPTADYKDRFPEGSGTSVSQGQDFNVFFNKAETIVIGHFYFRKLTDRELVKTSMGRVFEVNEDFEKIRNDLEKAGETVVDTRTIKDSTFFIRLFDGSDWLEAEEETVFDTIPLVPVYANYKVIENKPLYHGAVLKLMDAQRVFNYAKSREIEEGALAPRAKYWMTQKQGEGFEDELGTLNTNNDPVQFYNEDESAPGPPQQQGGAQINAGLVTLSEDMRTTIGQNAGIFAAGMGNTPAFAQSGVAIEKLQIPKNNVTGKYIKALEVAICRTGQLLNEAIPKVYDADRTVRIMKEDGSFDIADINTEQLDEESGEMITLNDLTVGKYDITCRAGPSFDSRQSESVSALMEIAAVDPNVLGLGLDVLLKNINAPGVNKIADRVRKQLVDSGVIPEDQLTDDEKAEIEAAAEAAAENPPQDAGILLAEAEMAKAEAEFQRNQVTLATKSAELQLKNKEINLKQMDLAIKGRAQDLAFAEKSGKLNLEADQQRFDQAMALIEQNNKEVNDAVDNLNTQADTMKKIREGMGVDAFTGPGAAAAFIRQTREVIQAQENT